MKKKRQEQQMDRISDLPDPIVHHVMSFLTTLDFTKISILSKRFFFLWSSFPVIDFNEAAIVRTYQGTLASRTDEFLNHIHNSIRLRRIDTVISEFRVQANLQGISADHRLDSAISFALDNGVKLLYLNLGISNYELPSAFASKSIKALILKGFELDLCKLIQSCPSLETLSLNSCAILQDINFSSQTLKKIELQCCVVKIINIKAPNLHSFFYDSGMKVPKPCWIDVLQCEKIAHLSLNNVVLSSHDWVEEHVSTLGKLVTFILNGCQDIQSIRVHNYRLERVEIGNCPALSSIYVIAPSLESFQYKGTDRNRVCNINFIASNCIKDLSIESAGITDEWLETQLTAFQFLESLSLKSCTFLKNIRVFHEKLQTLKLLDCDLVEVEVDTPKLISFFYLGTIVDFLKMVTRSGCIATLSIKPWIIYNNEAFYRWRKFLSFFGHCKALKLFCSSQKDLIIPEYMREKLVPPLYDLQYLEVHLKSLEGIETTDLLDSLLWLSPLPHTLTIFLYSRLQTIIKFTYEETIKEEEDKIPFCCTSKPIKCWRHNLTRLEIQTNDSVSPMHGQVKLQKYFLSNASMLDSIYFTRGFV